MQDLIPLQTAYIRQSRDVEDNTWVVFNTDNEEIGKLPNTLSPKEAMSYLHFARPFELEALNIGIQFGKKQAETYLIQKAEQAHAFAEAMAAENERLSMKILQMIERGAE